MVLTNSFHGTTYTTTKTREELDHIEEHIRSRQGTNSERAFARRVWLTLCGVEGCQCGNGFGER